MASPELCGICLNDTAFLVSIGPCSHKYCAVCVGDILAGIQPHLSREGSILKSLSADWCTLGASFEDPEARAAAVSARIRAAASPLCFACPGCAQTAGAVDFYPQGWVTEEALAAAARLLGACFAERGEVPPAPCGACLGEGGGVGGGDAAAGGGCAGGGGGCAAAAQRAHALAFRRVQSTSLLLREACAAASRAGAADLPLVCPFKGCRALLCVPRGPAGASGVGALTFSGAGRRRACPECGRGLCAECGERWELDVKEPPSAAPAASAAAEGEGDGGEEGGGGASPPAPPPPAAGPLHGLPHDGSWRGGALARAARRGGTASLCHADFPGCAPYGGAVARGRAVVPGTKLCPGCEKVVDRPRGDACHHVGCTICGTSFCYVCCTPLSQVSGAVHLCPLYCSDACDCTAAGEPPGAWAASAAHVSAVAALRARGWGGPRAFHAGDELAAARGALGGAPAARLRAALLAGDGCTALALLSAPALHGHFGMRSPLELQLWGLRVPAATGVQEVDLEGPGRLLSLLGPRGEALPLQRRAAEAGADGDATLAGFTGHVDNEHGFEQFVEGRRLLARWGRQALDGSLWTLEFSDDLLEISHPGWELSDYGSATVELPPGVVLMHGGQQAVLLAEPAAAAPTPPSAAAAAAAAAEAAASDEPSRVEVLRALLLHLKHPQNLHRAGYNPGEDAPLHGAYGWVSHWGGAARAAELLRFCGELLPRALGGAAGARGGGAAAVAALDAAAQLLLLALLLFDAEGGAAGADGVPSARGALEGALDQWLSALEGARARGLLPPAAVAALASDLFFDLAGDGFFGMTGDHDWAGVASRGVMRALARRLAPHADAALRDGGHSALTLALAAREFGAAGALLDGIAGSAGAEAALGAKVNGVPLLARAVAAAAAGGSGGDADAEAALLARILRMASGGGTPQPPACGGDGATAALPPAVDTLTPMALFFGWVDD